MSNVKVFGLLIDMPAQQVPIKAHCYGDCAKVSMAGLLNDANLGVIAVCCEIVCPHLDKEMTEPIGTTVFRHERGDTTYDVYLRTVK